LTVIIVSHDLRTVAEMSDRLACLNVTLHYHDVPHRMPAELARELFGADVEETLVQLRTPVPKYNMLSVPPDAGV
jgi:ABC-type Mn2+/Zn2+ transport system ATPase subunit